MVFVCCNCCFFKFFLIYYGKVESKVNININDRVILYGVSVNLREEVIGFSFKFDLLGSWSEF